MKSSISHMNVPCSRIRAGMMLGPRIPMYRPVVTAASTPDAPTALAGMNAA